MVDENFGAYLRYLRNLRDLSVTELAKLSGISPSYVSQIENGGRSTPQPDIIRKLAPHLGVGFYELMAKAGYLPTDCEYLRIDDEQTKKLFTELTEAKKELLRAVDGLSEEAITLLVQTIKNLK